jgi:hypothetical protein
MNNSNNHRNNSTRSNNHRNNSTRSNRSNNRNNQTLSNNENNTYRRKIELFIDAKTNGDKELTKYAEEFNKSLKKIHTKEEELKQYKKDHKRFFVNMLTGYKKTLDRVYTQYTNLDKKHVFNEIDKKRYNSDIQNNYSTYEKILNKYENIYGASL